jgi:hypothetical protein
MLQAMIREFVCCRCGDSFSRKWFPSWPERKFCGKTCELAWRAEDEGMKEHGRRGLAMARESPKMQAYLASDRNPFRGSTGDPIRRRGQATNAANGWPGLTGGNGRGLTTPQELLLRQLGEGFIPECSVRLGRKAPGYPTNYKLDLGNPELKIGIELNGESHRSAAARARDEKKRLKLESLGWTVLAFWNEEVLKDLFGTLRQIQETISRTAS